MFGDGMVIDVATGIGATVEDTNCGALEGDNISVCDGCSDASPENGSTDGLPNVGRNESSSS